MIADGLASIHDTYDFCFKLQFLRELAQNSRWRVFVFADPAARQSPRKARMIRMFNQKNTPLIVENHG